MLEAEIGEKGLLHFFDRFYLLTQQSGAELRLRSAPAEAAGSSQPAHRHPMVDDGSAAAAL